ncbi:MAG: hypothetical protein BGO70_17280 [Bacteroidetes bacterium 43-93]|nr:hypothetical protein [Bacteroidota bacterium]OJX01503.1 MAG: hypothetical protein BGO70_17280 [Bacteroidetes bacterium 43-93]
MDNTSLAHITNTLNDWLRALEFYKTELGILKSRLTEIGGKNTGRDMLRLVEHYESQFALHQENIDKLSHDINATLAAIHEGLRHSHSQSPSDIVSQGYDLLAHRFETEETVVSELRRAFNRFSSVWM